MNPLTNIQRRFDFVKEDIEKIEKILKMIGVNLEAEYNHSASIQTLMSNIEIAVDLGDNESEGWENPYTRSGGNAVAVEEDIDYLNDTAR